MRSIRNGFAVAAVLLFLGWMFAASAGAQTLGPPVATRGDSLLSGSATVVWPATYDSSRAIVTICGQIRVAGSTKAAVCRTKTGPWVRHVVAPPPVTLARVLVSPKVDTLLTGAQRQFSASALMSDGTTQPLVPLWAATGGGITSSGLYTAGSLAGAYMVIASSGTKADTARLAVQAPPPPPPPPPANAAPVAHFTWTCTGLNVRQCRFDASSSTDDVGVVAWRWDFSTGWATINVASAVFTITFPAYGTYTATLTVVDGAGLTGSSTQTILVPDPAAPPPPPPPPGPPPLPVNGLVLSAFVVGPLPVDTAVASGTWTDPAEVVDSVTADFVNFWAGGPVNALRRVRVAPGALSVVLRQPVPANWNSFAQTVNVCRWRAGVATCADQPKLVVPVP